MRSFEVPVLSTTLSKNLVALENDKPSKKRLTIPALGINYNKYYRICQAATRLFLIKWIMNEFEVFCGPEADN